MFARHGFKESALLEENGDRIATMPILVLNAHSRCNCRCVMCDIWKRDEAAEITAAKLERHRESFRRLSVEWVVLTGGEPLMHSDLRSLCMFFRELNIRITLLTTGLLLARRAEDVATLFDDVIISLDGPQTVHDAIRRVPGGFALIQTGISAVRKLRPEMKITCRSTVQKQNYAYLRATVDSARALGLDGISFLAADVTSEAFNRPRLWPSERQHEVGLSSDDIRNLEQEMEGLISEYADDIRDAYIAEKPTKLRKIVAHFKAHLGLADAQSPFCNAPWVSAVVETNGSVRPCFFHPPVGNLQNGTFEEIVNGDVARSFRHELDVASDPICRNCVCSLYRA
jgi:MoaA/NifB/PqqE/SkfB family radical SAM enzyme